MPTVAGYGYDNFGGAPRVQSLQLRFISVTTALYDASVNLVDSLAVYGKQLISQDYAANGIVVILTDGMDEHSTLTAKSVKEAFSRAMVGESLESLVSILIGINVTDQRVLAAMWDGEAELRKQIRQAFPDLLSRPSGDWQ